MSHTAESLWPDAPFGGMNPHTPMRDVPYKVVSTAELDTYYPKEDDLDG